MSVETKPKQYDINGESFTVVKPVRLNFGMVLHSDERDVYARISNKKQCIDEQTQTVALYDRGFPVPKVLDSGPYNANDWYFIEESAGDEPFHVQFQHDFESYG